MLTFNKITIIMIITLIITSLFLYQNIRLQNSKIDNLIERNNLLENKLTEQSKSIKEFKKDLENNIKIINEFNLKDNEIEKAIKELSNRYNNTNIKKELNENPKKFEEKINKEIKIQIKELNNLGN